MNRSCLIATALLLCQSGSIAHADEPPVDLAIGDSILSLITLDDFSQQLVQGDRVLIRDDRIVPDEQMMVGDAFVRALHVGSGGSSCSGGLQLLIERHGQVSVTEATDPCLYPDVHVVGETVELRVPPRPAMPGARWRWTPAEGLIALPDQPFVPDDTIGWDDLGSLASAHPIDALSLAPVYHQFRNGLPPEAFESLAITLGELGSGGTTPEGYEGETCAKWECETIFAHLWIDASRRQAYAFWRDDEGEHASPMPLADWPRWVVLRAAERMAARE